MADCPGLLISACHDQQHTIYAFSELFLCSFFLSFGFFGDCCCFFGFVGVVLVCCRKFSRFGAFIPGVRLKICLVL